MSMLRALKSTDRNWPVTVPGGEADGGRLLATRPCHSGLRDGNVRSRSLTAIRSRRNACRSSAYSDVRQFLSSHLQRTCQLLLHGYIDCHGDSRSPCKPGGCVLTWPLSCWTCVEPGRRQISASLARQAHRDRIRDGIGTPISFTGNLTNVDPAQIIRHHRKPPSGFTLEDPCRQRVKDAQEWPQFDVERIDQF